MDIFNLPFNRLIGLIRSPAENGHLVTLAPSSQHANHLGTVHAAVLLAVAEAGSAEFLLRHWGDADGLLPLVRRMDVKFRKPVQGTIYARARTDAAEVAKYAAELRAKGRVLVPVAMEVVDESGDVALTGIIEWFVTLR